MPKSPIPVLAASILFLAQTLFAQAQSPDAAKSAQPAQPPALAPAPAVGAPQNNPANAPPAKPTKAQELLIASIEKVRKLKSISTDISMKGEALNVSFQVDGQYLRAPGNKAYLRLNLSGSGDATGSMLQVCDGAILWDVYQVLTDSRYSKLEIQKVLAKLEDPGLEKEIRDMVKQQMGLSGPEAFLDGLNKTITFDQQEESTLNGIPVYVIRGAWTNRDRLSGPDGQPLGPKMPFPPFVPSVAAVWLGKEDGWPYKVEMRGQVRSELAADNPANRKTDITGKRANPAAAKRDTINPTSLVLIYGNVKLNSDIPDEKFAFQPPRQIEQAKLVQDQTPQYLMLLDNQIQQNAAKKAGATKANSEKTDGSGSPIKP